ncbi:hypothetical protein CQA38_01340 [Campylobacter sp. MIT 12-5580]|uniref:nickel/cobalt transporter n=1 Tax=Campylobacter sp. MIT 12-5580 TaxID=2040651 RepID=UPI0010F8DC85|nr:DUF1007 family protein [Campylobacter sp. MIT 12-5580]TKX30312.1 hypothetical protein CQA38_01340 [Campylobacter sp. MIT 12-5580]
MKKILLFCILFFSSELLACALCAAYTPKTHISIEFIHENSTLKGAKLVWSFSKEFKTVLLQSYDMNYNEKFDKKELEIIEAAMLDYLKPRHFLTHINTYENNAKKELPFQAKSLGFSEENDELIYTYELDFKLKLEPLSVFSLHTEDKEGFFDLAFLPFSPIKFDENLILQANENTNVIFFELTFLNAKTQNHQKTLNLSDEKGFLDSLLQKARDLNFTLLNFIKEGIKEQQSITSVLIFILLSFGYGVFHAAAPGHSKLLASSYFLSHKSSYLKALSFALKVALIHIISAFLLVSIGLFILKTFVTRFASEASFIITQFSSVLIIFIALVLLSKKILHSKHEKHCSCATCTHSNAKLSDFSVILAASILPCPTMVLVFVLGFEFSFFYALISAVFIALGMALVVFFAAAFAHKIHQKTSHETLRKSLEYLALIVMILLGFFIFFNAKSGVF